MNSELKSELKDIILTYIQYTNYSVSKEITEYVGITDDNIIGCKKFYSLYISNKLVGIS